MKYTKIVLSSTSTLAVNLPIAGYTGAEPFILKNADGLGPPEIDVFLINSNADNPAYFQGRKPQNRQLVFQVGLNPDYSIGQNASDLRDMLYKLLLKNYTYSNIVLGGNPEQLEVQIVDDPTGFILKTTGYISKMEVVPFSKDPEVQITIDCISPYLEGEDVDCTSDFPNITNIGDAPSGFVVNLQGPDEGHFSIQNVAGIGVDLAGIWGSDYSLRMDTRPGSRELSMIFNPTGGVVENELAFVTDAIPFGWIMLYPGLNELSLPVATTEYDGIPKYFTAISCIYTPRYWGV